jgi:K+-sensing histidine kinase KdpD
MGTVVELREPMTPPPELARPTGNPSRRAWILAAAAMLGPIGVSLLLIPWRGRLTAADDALILVVVIVAVASWGHRWAAALCALASALSLDVFLTRPYGSFRISRSADLLTTLLLLVVGLAVGELAARGVKGRADARQGREHVAMLHAVNELSADGRAPEDVVSAAREELARLLQLRSCTFARAGDTPAAAILPDGSVRIHSAVWNTEDLGLPHRGVDLPVRSGGSVLGHFLLVPVPGSPVTRDRLLVAVALADQVGAALAVAGNRVRPHP